MLFIQTRMYVDNDHIYLNNICFKSRDNSLCLFYIDLPFKR